MGQHRTALPPPATRGARRGLRPRRAAVLGALLAAGSTVLTLMLGRQTMQAWPGTDSTSVEGALLVVALTASTVLTGWVSVLLTLVVSDLVREGDLPPRRSMSPTVRWTSAALLAITATPTAAALAGPPQPSWTSGSSDATDGPPAATGQNVAAGSAAASDPDPPPEQRLLPDGSSVPLPGWTPMPAPPPATPTTVVGLVSVAPREAPPEHVVVRAGDTLWSIAARQLGPSATVQDIAEEWPRWHAANRGVIGSDPDLILPGQELRIPGPGSAAPPAATPREGTGR